VFFLKFNFDPDPELSEKLDPDPEPDPEIIFSAPTHCQIHGVCDLRAVSLLQERVRMPISRSLPRVRLPHSKLSAGWRRYLPNLLSAWTSAMFSSFLSHKTSVVDPKLFAGSGPVMT